jgi:hypothetical protein
MSVIAGPRENSTAGILDGQKRRHLGRGNN